MMIEWFVLHDAVFPKKMTERCSNDDQTMIESLSIVDQMVADR